MMIEINLLPEELKKSQPKLRKADLSKLNLQNIPVIKIAIASIAVLISVHFLLFAIGMYAKFSIASLSKNDEKISPKKKEAETLKRQREMINKKVSAIDELMVKRFSWARKLNDLSDSVTPGIWLRNISYEEKIIQPAGGKEKKELLKSSAPKPMLKYLMMSGYASSMGEQGAALVGKFMKSLKENRDFYADFSDIQLGSIRSDKIEDQEVMSFTITCLLKGQDGTENESR